MSVVDRVFVRSGASDAMSRGLSTFMVEMMETASILRQCSERSLVIMDEIGRGTSTYDGISVAWSVAEYLLKESGKVGPWVLFATHYHELQELELVSSRMKNFRVTVDDSGDDLVFLHKVVAGGAGASFGIEVAKIAGVPKEVILNADKKLVQLENNVPKDESKSDSKLGQQLGFVVENVEENEVVEKLKKIDVNKMTPVEALVVLGELVEEVG